MSNSILDAIRERDLMLYGSICDNEFCTMHKEFCRCESSKNRKNSSSIWWERTVSNDSSNKHWNDYYLNEEELNKRMDIIGRNGGDGEHYFSMSYKPEENTVNISIEPVGKLEDTKSVNKVRKFFRWLWRIFK